jgi:hypothetical protein
MADPLRTRRLVVGNIGPRASIGITVRKTLRVSRIASVVLLALLASTPVTLSNFAGA